MITFLWMHCVEHTIDTGQTLKRRRVEVQAIFDGKNTPEPMCWVFESHTSNGAMHLIPLTQEKLSQVRAVLPSDPGDQSTFHALLRTPPSHQRKAGPSCICLRMFSNPGAQSDQMRLAYMLPLRLLTSQHSPPWGKDYSPVHKSGVPMLRGLI